MSLLYLYHINILFIFENKLKKKRGRPKKIKNNLIIENKVKIKKVKLKKEK
jgi:hypothetical protein